jgi:hypothetical protein
MTETTTEERSDATDTTPDPRSEGNAPVFNQAGEKIGRSRIRPDKRSGQVAYGPELGVSACM